MSIDLFNPPPGDFPPTAFARRRVHLLREINRSQAQPPVIRDVARRPLLALAVVAVLVVLPVSALAVTGTIPLSDWPFYRWHALVPGMEPANPGGVVIVTRGSFAGHQWVLEAFRSKSDQLCFGITNTNHGLPISTGGGGLGCGTATPAIRPAMGGDGKPGSPFVAYGSAAKTITTVEIRLANGHLLRAATVSAPAGLGLPVRFYVAKLPTVSCVGSSARRLAARITRYRGLDGRGTVVTRRAIPLPPPGVPLNYRCPTKGTFFSGRPTRQLTPTAALHSLHPVLHVTGSFGAAATLSISSTVTTKPAAVVRTPRGHVVHVAAIKSRCWRIVFSRGAPESDCRSLIATGPWVSVLGVQPSGRDVFIVAQTRPPVAHVRVRFSDGDTIDATPAGGIVVIAVPRAHLATTAQRVTLTGLNKNGAKVGFNTWAYYRMRPSDRQPEPQ